MKKHLLLLLFIAIIAGCASKDVRRVNNLTVPVGQESTAIVGVPFVSHEYGTIESNSQWQGVMFGGMHHSTHHGKDYRLVHIYYGGIQDSVVTLLYQETIGESETPHISKPYTVDVNKTDSINIRGYKVTIHEASPSSMRYTLKSKPK